MRDVAVTEIIRQKGEKFRRIAKALRALSDPSDRSILLEGRRRRFDLD
jgi:hypothetical protein